MANVFCDFLESFVNSMEEKTNSPKKRTVAIIVASVLALVFLIVAGAAIAINQTLNLINRDTAIDATLSDEEIESILMETDPDEAVENIEELEQIPEQNVEDAEVLEEDEKIVNILLIGQDRREGQKRQRSDAMILCTINLEEKTLVLTSFLRDTYLKIPDWNGKQYGSNRLNVCYGIGGMEMLDQCLLDNFGITVDYNVEVDFFSFSSIVDLLGGVEIELTASEAGHLNYICAIGNSLKEGVNLLDGNLALQYSRIRKLDSDFARTNRQRNVVLAFMEKAKTMSLSQVIDIVVEVFPMITTDMTNGAIYDLAVKMLPVLPELQVTSQHIPADGTYYFGQIPGMSAIAFDMEANRQILKDTIGIAEPAA